MQRPLCLLLLAFAACSTTTPNASRPGPEIQIPVFAADDARVNKPGFVKETLRLSKDDGDTRYTLMVYVVGETLTLGAMVKGGFAGDVEWHVGDRTMTLPFDAGKPQKETAVAVHGSGDKVTAQGAQFQGTSWTSIDVPVSKWLAEGALLSLTFKSPSGATQLPDAGVSYVARFAMK